ncbi:hypothetical protein LSH36_71g02000 [Paralvinella palmiformis]|uniref:Uncharacterized protein n=1 Tax=Paralvinella palmiformis TaxID=53620 RepID=A0AAD9K393_9ANNE|nr:hypothetical protein LSH36_71g02000 [Paralvinella palmiformis]
MDSFKKKGCDITGCLPRLFLKRNSVLSTCVQQRFCSMRSRIFCSSYPLFPSHWIHFSQTHPPLIMPLSNGSPYFSGLDLKPHEKKLKHHFKQAMTPHHFLANLLHPVYRGNIKTNINPEMSVVTLQIGQCGNQIGCDFFSTLMLNLVKEGKHGSNEQENYFREIGIQLLNNAGVSDVVIFVSFYLLVFAQHKSAESKDVYA